MAVPHRPPPSQEHAVFAETDVTPAPASTLTPYEGPPVVLDDNEISLFDLGALLLIHRRALAAWALLGALAAALPATFQKRTWTSETSFIAEGDGAEAQPGGLGRIAGQFGFSLPVVTARQSPDFYSELVESRAILGRIARDTVAVPENNNGAPQPVYAHLDVTAQSPAIRNDHSLRALRKAVSLRASDAAILTVSVTTPFPSLSTELARRIVDELNRFNLEAGQSRASEERRFIEARLQHQRQLLREAEGRLSAFLAANRQFANSPDLTFQHDRLQREVSLRQQVLVDLAQASEQARLREVRNVRTITVIDPPSVPVQPNPRGRLKRALLGFVAGFLLGVFVMFVKEFFRARRAIGDPRAERFYAVLADARHRLIRPRATLRPS